VTAGTDSTSADWDRLIAEFPDSVERSVVLGIVTQAEADALLEEFRHLSVDQRQRAVLREGWRQVDALEVNAQISGDDAATTRQALLDDANGLGFGEPPW
jgi:hypothetical protein